LPLPKSSLYLLEQVNIIAYDYEGYGKAPGNPNEQSCYENIELVIYIPSFFSHFDELELCIPSSLKLIMSHLIKSSCESSLLRVSDFL
jgi:hypothetical protein